MKGEAGDDEQEDGRLDSRRRIQADGGGLEDPPPTTLLLTDDATAGEWPTASAGWRGWARRQGGALHAQSWQVSTGCDAR